MALKKPLANYTGTLQEIGAGDTVDRAVLGSGTADSTKFLRGDSTWATPGSVIPDDARRFSFFAGA